MAEIKLLRVSENGRPPFWIYISGFFFCLIFVISVSFYIGLPHFDDVISIFSRWRPAAILYLIWIILHHPLSVNVGLRLVLKFGLDQIHSFGDIVIFSERSRSRSLYVVVRSSLCLSVVCLSVTFVHPNQAIEIFAMFPRHLIRWSQDDIQVKFHGDRPGEPLCRAS